MESLQSYADQLIQSEHYAGPDIDQRKKDVLERWEKLKEALVEKRAQLGVSQTLQQFSRDTNVIETYVLEKLKLAQEENYKDPTEQRKVKVLKLWEQLKDILNERICKVEEAGDLNLFLNDLAHFQAWLSNTESDIANGDSPSSLAEAEKLLSTHQQIAEEIDTYVNDYRSMIEYGEKITADESTFDDPQYILVRESLKSLKDGWGEVQQMWQNRQNLLSQSLKLQMFRRDAKQAEILLLSKKHLLSNNETPVTLEQSDMLIKRDEALFTTMNANKHKLKSFADTLLLKISRMREYFKSCSLDCLDKRKKN